MAVTATATRQIKDSAITNAKRADMAANTIKARKTNSTGPEEDATAAEVRTIINVANGATANSSDATLLARANHTGTQLASTISDFAATVRATVLTGLSLVTNQAVAATDTILQAIGYLQKQITDLTALIPAAQLESIRGSRFTTTNPHSTFQDTGITVTLVANKWYDLDIYLNSASVPGGGTETYLEVQFAGPATFVSSGVILYTYDYTVSPQQIIISSGSPPAPSNQNGTGVFYLYKGSVKVGTGGVFKVQIRCGGFQNYQMYMEAGSCVLASLR